MAQSGFAQTSEPTPNYNCIAWAAGRNDQWWEAFAGYWPQGIALDGSLASLVHLFASLGYETCADGTLHSGFEKIALYAGNYGYTLAARQLPTGRWTSKLGRLDDIEHTSPYDLQGEAYGLLAQFMRRARPS